MNPYITALLSLYKLARNLKISVSVSDVPYMSEIYFIWLSSLCLESSQLMFEPVHLAHRIWEHRHDLILKEKVLSWSSDHSVRTMWSLELLSVTSWCRFDLRPFLKHEFGTMVVVYTVEWKNHVTVKYLEETRKSYIASKISHVLSHMIEVLSDKKPCEPLLNWSQ